MNRKVLLLQQVNLSWVPLGTENVKPFEKQQIVVGVKIPSESEDHFLVVIELPRESSKESIGSNL